MARSGAGFYPWDKENPNEKDMYQSKYRDVLNKQRPTLVTVDIKPMFPFLLQLGVIDTFAKDRIELNATRAEMNSNVADHIERGPCTRLHGYLRACVLTNQEHIVTLLGFDPRVYRLPRDVLHTTPPVQQGGSVPAGWLAQPAPPLLQYTGGGAVNHTSPVPVRPVREPHLEDINAHPGDVIDETKRNRLITDLSAGLGEDWYRCGVLLGLDSPMLDSIKSGESPSGPALKMLIKWRQQNGKLTDADLKSCLCRGLQRAGLDVHVDFVTDSHDTLEEIFAKLSGHLGKQWKNLAYELDIQRSDIEVMTTQIVRSHKDCAEDMLIRWSQGSHRDDVVKLKKALWHVERKDLMTNIERYIVRQQ